MNAPICIPANSAQGFPFPCIRPTTCYSCHFGSGHPNGCEVISLSGFDVRFPDGYWCWAPVLVPVGHLCIFFGKNVCSGPLLHFQLDCLYFCYWVVWVLYIVWILITYHMYDFRYSFSLSSLPFDFADGFLCCAEGFFSPLIWCRPTYLFWLLLPLLLVSVPGKSSPSLILKYLSLVYFKRYIYLFTAVMGLRSCTGFL